MSDGEIREPWIGHHGIRREGDICVNQAPPAGFAPRRFNCHRFRGAVSKQLHHRQRRGTECYRRQRVKTARSSDQLCQLLGGLSRQTIAGDTDSHNHTRACVRLRVAPVQQLPPPRAHSRLVTECNLAAALHASNTCGPVMSLWDKLRGSSGEDV